MHVHKSEMVTEPCRLRHRKTAERLKAAQYVTMHGNHVCMNLGRYQCCRFLQIKSGTNLIK